MTAMVHEVLSFLAEHGQSKNVFIDGGMAQEFFEKQGNESVRRSPVFVGELIELLSVDHEAWEEIQTMSRQTKEGKDWLEQHGGKLLARRPESVNPHEQKRRLPPLQEATAFFFTVLAPSLQSRLPSHDDDFTSAQQNAGSIFQPPY